MKITGVRIDQKTVRFTPKYKTVARSCNPLDVYEEFASGRSTNPQKAASGSGDGWRSELFVVIKTDGGVEGFYGPVESRPEILAITDGIARLLIGRDPLDNRTLWDIISRHDRHCRSGIMMMAISAVDIALWDLKGKILGLPVYKILGGGRNKLRPYISMLGFSVEPDDVRKSSLEVKEIGVPAQKWFFRYGPADGAAGLRKNLDMAYALRETLGEDYELMFDAFMGWDISYAKRMLRGLEQVRPVWMEEILRPHMLDGFMKLKEETSIPLSTGEHLYTRMEVNNFLKNHTIDVMQSDPVWCGGITECLRIGDLCEMYGVTFVPHGHSLLPAMHVVASLPPEIAPYCEYLLNFMDSKTAFHKQKYLTDDGWLIMNDTPGLGEDFDEDRLIESKTVHEFAF